MYFLTSWACLGGKDFSVGHLYLHLDSVEIERLKLLRSPIEVRYSHMDAGNMYRSHFGSRYHTRADAVTQAFLLRLFNSLPIASLLSLRHVPPCSLPHHQYFCLAFIASQMCSNNCARTKSLLLLCCDRDFPQTGPLRIRTLLPLLTPLCGRQHQGQV